MNNYVNATETTEIAVCNLTPHTVNIVLEDGSVIDYPPFGRVARVSAQTKRVGMVGNIPITVTVFGEVEGLPDPEEGVIYIVSSLVAQRVPDRLDVFVPSESVRDENGRIIGCRSLGRV